MIVGTAIVGIGKSLNSLILSYNAGILVVELYVSIDWSEYFLGALIYGYSGSSYSNSIKFGVVSGFFFISLSTLLKNF